MLNLSLAEARVLGSLIEKGITTPEYYPLSLNALVNACNQKSSRDPVMDLTEAGVRSALFELENLGLVRVLAEARVSKFEHLAFDRLNLRRPEIAVLCLLLLRGPQTPAELRARADRLYAFDDTEAVAASLERLATRDDPLTRQLPRQSGSRESRWLHLLSGSEAAPPEHPTRHQPQPEASPAETSLQQRVTALERLVHALEERLNALEDKDQPS